MLMKAKQAYLSDQFDENRDVLKRVPLFDGIAPSEMNSHDQDGLN